MTSTVFGIQSKVTKQAKKQKRMTCNEEKTSRQGRRNVILWGLGMLLPTGAVLNASFILSAGLFMKAPVCTFYTILPHCM